MTERRDLHKSISDEAAEWFVLLKDGNLPLAKRREYLQWLKASPAHIAEILRMSKLYGLLRSARLEAPVTDAPASNVVTLVTRDVGVSPPPPQRTAPQHWKIAATFSALALASLLALMFKTAWLDRTFETQAGEWHNIALPDGSTVRMGPRTRLHTEFDSERRLVHLRSGEAIFGVVKDAQRPFYVSTNLAVARAVGTEFGVSHEKDGVLVTVAHGLVAVSRSSRDGSLPGVGIGGAGNTEEITLSQNQQVAILRTGAMVERRVDAARELEWAKAQLSFNDVSFADAAAEFNRRNLVQIVINDPVLATRPVFGVFHAADPEEFLRTLAKKETFVIIADRPGILLVEPRISTTPAAGSAADQSDALPQSDVD